MSTTYPERVPRPAWISERSASALVLWGGFALCAAPTLLANLHESWSTEQGEHAPIVLALGVWLLARAWPEMRRAATRGGWVQTGCLAAAAIGLYVVGRVAQQFIIESYGLYLLSLAALYAQLGFAGLMRGRFALGYLILSLPPPYSLSWLLTNHLRLWVTQAAVATYQAFGVEIVRDGLNILVDQYDLAVKEACSGMNSLVSLTALGLIYLHLRRSPPSWYYGVLIVPIVGFAILANFVRILVLIGLTHAFGDAVAQSFLHETAGLVTFAVALVGVVVVDAVLGRWCSRASTRAERAG